MDNPPYHLNPKTGIFSPQGDTAPMRRQIITKPNLSLDEELEYIPYIDMASRQLAERKQQVVRIPGDIGAEIKLEWFEFVDREAKSLYYSELLRRTAWETPPKDE